MLSLLFILGIFLPWEFCDDVLLLPPPVSRPCSKSWAIMLIASSKGMFRCSCCCPCKMFKVTELWSSFKGVTRIAKVTPREVMLEKILAKSTLGLGKRTSTFKPMTLSLASILSAYCLCCRETQTISQSLDLTGGCFGGAGASCSCWKRCKIALGGRTLCCHFSCRCPPKLCNPNLSCTRQLVCTMYI